MFFISGEIANWLKTNALRTSSCIPVEDNEKIIKKYTDDLVSFIHQKGYVIVPENMVDYRLTIIRGEE